jgi:hypothetical protein
MQEDVTQEELYLRQAGKATMNCVESRSKAVWK